MGGENIEKKWKETNLNITNIAMQRYAIFPGVRIPIGLSLRCFSRGGVGAFKKSYKISKAIYSFELFKTVLWYAYLTLPKRWKIWHIRFTCITNITAQWYTIFPGVRIPIGLSLWCVSKGGVGAFKKSFKISKTIYSFELFKTVLWYA